MRLLRFILAAALLAPIAAQAQFVPGNTTGVVVSACGTPPTGTMTVGNTAPITIDTTGKLCTSGGAGGGIAIGAAVGGSPVNGQLLTVTAGNLAQVSGALTLPGSLQATNGSNSAVAIAIGQANTGVNSQALGNVSIVASGVEGMRITSNADYFLQNAGFAGMATFGSVSLASGVAGQVGFTKISDPGTAAGSLSAKFHFQCGTTAGTVKMCFYAGTSTTPFCPATLDNIGGGVSGC